MLGKFQNLPVFLGQALLSTSVLAVNPSVPAELQFQGMPIDSLCFAGLETKGNRVDLRKCGAKQEKYTVKKSENELSKKGYLGFEWEDPSIPSGGAQGYSYYQFFDAGNHQYWIYSINNGGGSGDFTNILLAKRIDENTLQLEALVGGDRCNGGVQDVALKNDKLNFSVNLTSYDLIALSENKIANVNAYDDLAACAVCCAATANYSLDLNKKVSLRDVELIKDVNTDELSEQGKYQMCFNSLYMNYVKKNETHLNQEKINTFATTFKNNCMGKEKK
jgi:hypothetical protein